MRYVFDNAGYFIHIIHRAKSFSNRGSVFPKVFVSKRFGYYNTVGSCECRRRITFYKRKRKDLKNRTIGIIDLRFIKIIFAVFKQSTFPAHKPGGFFHLGIIFFQCLCKRRLCERPVGILIAFLDIGNNPENAICFFVITVIVQFIAHIKDQEEAERNANSKP